MRRTTARITHVRGRQPVTRGHLSAWGRIRRWLANPILAGIVGILGLLVSLIAWWWPSPASNVGSAFHSTAGGQDPSALFGGKTEAQVSNTRIMMFDRTTTEPRGKPFDLGPPHYSTVCAESYSIPGTAGAYRCVLVTEMGNPAWVQDPCFGVDAGHVYCVLGNDTSWRLAATAKGGKPIRTYNPPISAVGKRFPWKLVLSSGDVCIWLWYPSDRRQWSSQWECSPASTMSPQPSSDKPPVEGEIVMPVRRGKLLGPGDDYLDYDGVFILPFRGSQPSLPAGELSQGKQSTWTVLVQLKDAPRTYQRLAVLEAWY
jgi:hypothetical protein